MGPESCLDMTNGDLDIGRRESSHERRGRVSVNEDHVRLQLSQCIGNLCYERCRQVRKRLALLHDAEVSPHPYLEHAHDVVQHLHVLAGQKHVTVEPRIALQRLDDGCHLDRLGARAKDG
jgi:hypothetical protein